MPGYFFRVISLSSYWIVLNGVHPLVLNRWEVSFPEKEINIGKGVSVSSQSMYESCFSDLMTQSPSFNITQRIEEIDPAALDGQKPVWLGNSRLYKFLQETTLKQEDLSARYLYSAYLIQVDIHGLSAKASQSSLKPEIKTILNRESGQLEFFSLCGSHYIRSLKKESHFIILFQYEFSGEEENSFHQKIKKHLQSIHYTQEHIEERKNSLHEEADQRNLKIYSDVYGIPRQSLPVQSLEDVKEAVSFYLNEVRREESGAIKQIELHPWLGLPEIREAMFARERTYGDLYTLQENIQLYLRIKEKSIQLEKEYATALACREKTRQLLDEAEDQTALIYSSRAKPIDARELYSYLSTKRLQSYSLRLDEFLYGSGTEKQTGAMVCLKLLEQDKFQPYSKILHCRAAENNLQLPESDPIFHDYCYN